MIVFFNFNQEIAAWAFLFQIIPKRECWLLGFPWVLRTTIFGGFYLMFLTFWGAVLLSSILLPCAVLLLEDPLLWVRLASGVTRFLHFSWSSSLPLGLNFLQHILTSSFLHHRSLCHLCSRWTPSQSFAFTCIKIKHKGTPRNDTEIPLSHYD